MGGLIARETRAPGEQLVNSVQLVSNSQLFQHMREDMDSDYGGILDGEYTVAERGEMIFQRILATTSGEKSASEMFVYGDNEFAPWRIGAGI